MKKNILALTFIASFMQAEPTAVNKPNVSQGLGNARAVSLIKATDNTSWVDQKIEEIKPRRNGLKSSSLAGLKSPFIVIKKKEKENGLKAKSNKAKSDSKSRFPTKRDMSKEPLTLQIILNSTALINGKWLKENDSFRGYKVAQIQTNHVVMERKNKKIKLFIAQKNDNINISTK